MSGRTDKYLMSLHEWTDRQILSLHELLTKPNFLTSWYYCSAPHFRPNRNCRRQCTGQSLWRNHFKNMFGSLFYIWSYLFWHEVVTFQKVDFIHWNWNIFWKFPVYIARTHSDVRSVQSSHVKHSISLVIKLHLFVLKLKLILFTVLKSSLC